MSVCLEENITIPYEWEDPYIDLEPISEKEKIEISNCSFAIHAKDKNVATFEVDFRPTSSIKIEDWKCLQKLSPRIVKLSLYGHQTLPLGLDEFYNLKELDLSYTKLRSSLFKELPLLKKLEILDFYGSSLNDIQLLSLKNLIHLKRIYLKKTKVKSLAREELQRSLKNTIII